ncbi:AAA family ATPase [Brucella sp. ZJ1_1]|uniref:Chromosome segregation protein SMC n=3 Tax=Brucella intermedia TaxID=94625 RepID=U4VF45_9HYPH|nr:AAA family ATPase [Brucella intermedia]ERM02924.1 chromosome segregation protein SMC [Brucella intermedia 229E]EEQ94440.1 SMC domain-containing protein [Brucella intermedia LMG 3301]ELT47041.1 SMC domain-containing protein [Brucella intermedia M86]OOC50591.1 chromosome segregation protein SMC [Brucella intermedia M86]SUA87344.1 chromosome segregation protein [Brucella intermedia]
MKFDYVEVCGFRGFRDKVRIDFGRGFTVITGRNGVGKSTLCDAVEFAITGLIEKYAVEKAAKESLADYLWWRGAGKPQAHYVTAAFIRDDGEPFTITRTREGGADRSPEEIQAALCCGPAPDDALRQLTRISIIRDEWIAALSLDLSETERFDLVRSALGALEGSEAAAKAREVVAAADAAHTLNEAAYETARTRLGERLTQQSEIQATLSRADDVSAALATVAAAAPEAPIDMAARLEAARGALVDGRARAARIADAVEAGQELLALQRTFNAPGAAAAREGAIAELETAREAKDLAMAAVEGAEALLAREEDADAVAASLAILVEHGERLGIHDEHCPLCAAERSSAEFAAGLDAARRRISSLASGVQEARRRLTAASDEAREAVATFTMANAQVAAHQDEERTLRTAEQTYVAFLERWRLDPRFLNDPGKLSAYLEAERDRLINLERALLVLDASQSVSRIASIEKNIEGLREEIDKLADAVSGSQAAVTSAREIERAVKRVSAEIIDERLAQISPLLNELYQRLRPHADWRTIDYSIRGDIKRFLSLKVGDGLNPQFVFSSGQRRAAGLAFLLSVYLARSWTSLHSLLLDDPVQHIDDFRALHLVEVLAALRLDHRQIICAVEDTALADLLCRRLVSTSGEPGRRYDIDLGPEGATSVLTAADIPPMPVGVLRSGLQVVGA